MIKKKGKKYNIQMSQYLFYLVINFTFSIGDILSNMISTFITFPNFINLIIMYVNNFEPLTQFKCIY